MHADAAAAGHETDDLVAGHGGAATGQADHQVVEALDVDADPLALVDPAGLAGRARQLDLVVATAQLAGDPLGDRLSRHVVLADGGVEGVEVGVVDRLGDADQHRRVGQLLHRQALFAQRLGQLLAPGLDGVLAPLPAEPLADLVAGPRADDDLEPVPARARRRAPWR